jgi:dienelactone hydrolase
MRPYTGIDRTPQLQAPLLGLFGAEDQTSSPPQVAELEQALKASGKAYEFHSLPGRGAAGSSRRTGHRTVPRPQRTAMRAS